MQSGVKRINLRAEQDKGEIILATDIFCLPTACRIQLRHSGLANSSGETIYSRPARRHSGSRHDDLICSSHKLQDRSSQGFRRASDRNTWGSGPDLSQILLILLEHDLEKTPSLVVLRGHVGQNHRGGFCKGL